MIELKKYDNGFDLEKSAYTGAEKELQERLYILFNECTKKNLSCLILLEGWAASGKGDALKTMTVRLDPRKFQVYIDQPGGGNYPFLHPYWNNLPYHGKSQFFIGSWYYRAVDRRMKEKDSAREFGDNVQSIINFERTIAAENYIIFKFFLHINRKEQAERMKAAKKSGLSWVVAKADANQNEEYKDYRRVFEEILSKTDSSASPWTIIPAGDKHYAMYTIMQTTIKSLEARLGVDSQQILDQVKRAEEMI